MSAWSHLLVPFTHPLLIVFVAIGCFAGIYIGAIPGLSATMAVSLLVSFTYGWETNSAIALMIGIFIGAVYGGSRSAILLNIPGAPAAVATALDGYPLAQKGEAGRAMGIATTQSVVGTLLGVVVLAVGAPAVSQLALKFSSVDYLLLGLMGMMMVGSLNCKSIFRGLMAAAIGVLLGTIGMDSMTAIPRFTFGNTYLNAGIDYVVAMIGLFGVSEALVQITEKDIEAVKQKVDKIVPSFDTILKYLPLTIRSSIVGVIVGALPGAGGDIAALLCYDQAKRTVKNPEVPFGEGAVEGIVAPESANNAAIGGAFIPIATLYSNFIISRGKSQVYMWNTIIQSLLLLLIIYGVQHFHLQLWGISGLWLMIVLYLLLQVLWLIVWHTFLWRYIRLTPLSALKATLPFLLMAAFATATAHFLTLSITSTPLLLLARIAVAATLYIAMLALTSRQLLVECIHFVRHKKQV